MSKVWRVKSPKLSDKFFIAFAFVYFLSSTYQAVHQQKFISNWNLQEPLMSRFMLIIFRLGESSSNPMATKNVVHGVIFKSTTRVHLRLISVWSSRAHRNIKLCRRLNAQSMERVCLFLKALGDKKNATCGRSHERKKWRKKNQRRAFVFGISRVARLGCYARVAQWGCQKKNQNKVEADKKTLFCLNAARLRNSTALLRVHICVMKMKHDKGIKKTRLWSFRVVIRLIWKFLWPFGNNLKIWWLGFDESDLAP